MSLWIPRKVHLFTLKLFVHCKKSLVVNFHCTFFCFKILVSILKFHCKSKAILVLGFVSVNGREGRSLRIFPKFGNPRGDKPALIPTLREIHSSIVNLMWFTKNEEVALDLQIKTDKYPWLWQAHFLMSLRITHKCTSASFSDRMKHNHKHLAENRSWEMNCQILWIGEIGKSFIYCFASHIFWINNFGFFSYPFCDIQWKRSKNSSHEEEKKSTKQK